MSEQQDDFRVAHPLAPHETLELHELLALKNFSLVKQKDSLLMISDPTLKHLYQLSIRTLERDIRELSALLERSPF